MKKLLFPLLVLTGFVFYGCEANDCCMPGVISIDPQSITLSGYVNPNILAAPATKVVAPPPISTQKVTVTSTVSWVIKGGKNALPPWLDYDILDNNPVGSVGFFAKSNTDEPRYWIVTFIAANGDKAILKVTQLPSKEILPPR
ncbi:MAG: hypothetical protein FWG54_06675 [Bacteroidetes bacterium]|nr:hypothetical protein [Bacteroidota bacterium]